MIFNVDLEKNSRMENTLNPFSLIISVLDVIVIVKIIPKIMLIDCKRNEEKKNLLFHSLKKRRKWKEKKIYGFIVFVRRHVCCNNLIYDYSLLVDSLI